MRAATARAASYVFFFPGSVAESGPGCRWIYPPPHFSASALGLVLRRSQWPNAHFIQALASIGSSFSPDRVSGIGFQVSFLFSLSCLLACSNFSKAAISLSESDWGCRFCEPFREPLEGPQALRLIKPWACDPLHLMFLFRVRAVLIRGRGGRYEIFRKPVLRCIEADFRTHFAVRLFKYD